MRLDHHADDAILAAGELLGHRFDHFELPLELLAAVAVRAVDHHLGRDAGRGQVAAGRLDAVRIVIGLLAAAQNDVAVFVARSADDGRVPGLGHRQEMVRRLGRLDGVDGDAHVAVGAVLEPDRAGETRSELAVHLALGGTRPDRAPGDEVGDVLRRDHVEELGGGRQPHLGDLPQQSTGEANAVVDAVGVVQVGIVDESFPAHRRARFLEVDPHHHQQLAAQPVSLFLEPAGVLQRRFRIVDGARPDDREQPVVGAVEDAMDRLAREEGGLGRGRRGGKLAQHVRWWHELLDLLDAHVVDVQTGMGFDGVHRLSSLAHP